ncbi:hypothetical protein AX16_007039 [Volvariella volvacea WC 439]|nr:hypothetical protein AX16_007039 [Volvariella volvacea WC 439]
MVNYMDPVMLARTSRVYGAFVLALTGMATWDVLSTLWFDISIIRGKRPWRWPMVLYFICRICMIMHIYAFAVNLNAISQIPCQEVTWISKVTDAIGTCGSSLILVLRTRAVWQRDLKVTVVLGALFLGQIAVWLQTFRYSRSRWDPQRNVCAVISTAPRPLLVTVFAYTMAFDLVILVLCSFKLVAARGSGALAQILLRDGIAYFCAAFGANLVQMIMASLALSPVMNIIALPFALVASVIASTTVFRNVFTLYDSWGKDTARGSGNTGSVSGPGLPRFAGGTGGGRLPFTTGQSNQVPTDNIPLGEYKSQDIGAISVHKVVDVDIDGVQATVSGKDSGKYAMAY